MKKCILTLATALLLVVPAAVSAQGFGLAARAGTLGVGPEAALGLTDAFVIRAGIGLMPFEPDLDRCRHIPGRYVPDRGGHVVQAG